MQTVGCLVGFPCLFLSGVSSHEVLFHDVPNWAADGSRKYTRCYSTSLCKHLEPIQIPRVLHPSFVPSLIRVNRRECCRPHAPPCTQRAFTVLGGNDTAGKRLWAQGLSKSLEFVEMWVCYHINHRGHHTHPHAWALAWIGIIPTHRVVAGHDREKRRWIRLVLTYQSPCGLNLFCDTWW